MRISPYCPLILLLFTLCGCEENDLINYKQQAQVEQKVPENTAIKKLTINQCHKVMTPFFMTKLSVEEHINNIKNENIIK